MKDARYKKQNKTNRTKEFSQRKWEGMYFGENSGIWLAAKCMARPIEYLDEDESEFWY